MARIRIEPGGKILLAVIALALVFLFYWKLKYPISHHIVKNRPASENRSRVAEGSAVDTSINFQTQQGTQTVSAAPLRIFFDFNRAGINKNVYCIFDRIEKTVKSKGLRRVEITVEGNADSTGPQWYNLILSRRRAERVADSLKMRLGIPSSSIKIVANGSSKPINSNLTRAGRADNRRVEVLIY
ncbi:MAG: OmpA family protein [Candidatus Kryptoniota bacterium]